MKKKALILFTAAMMLSTAAPTVLAQEEKEDVRMELEYTNDTESKITDVNVSEEEDSVAVTLTDDAGENILFSEVPLNTMSDIHLIKDGAFYYLSYTSLASGKERRVGQDGEYSFDTPLTYYAIDDVYLREYADTDSEILCVVKRGDEITVIGETANFFKLEYKDQTGYSVKTCVSDDEQDAINAVVQQNAEIQRQQAAAASRSSSSSGNNIVSVEKVPSCEGGGDHGTKYITYSNGTVDAVEY